MFSNTASANGVANRVKIVLRNVGSLDADSSKLPLEYPFKGSGVVVCWLKSLTTTIAGLEEAVSISEASGSSSATILPGTEVIFSPLRTMTDIGTSIYTGAIPVIAGESTINIELYASSKTPYSFNFSVSDTLPKFDAISDTIQIPTLIRTSINETDSKKTYKLTVEAVFVPYVKGRLQIELGPILFQPTVLSKYAGGHQGALRASLGTSHYGFSSPFELIPVVAEAVNTDKKKSATDKKEILKKAQSATDLISRKRVVFNVDTFNYDWITDVISNHDGRLLVQLIDLDDSNGGLEYYIGSGVMNINALYYLSLCTATGSLFPSTSNSDASNTVGVSPWSKAAVEMKDTITNKAVATAALSVQFLVESVNEKVTNEIRLSKVPPVSLDSTSRSKMELGLKQAFVAADTDGTGKISSNELLAVIMKGKSKDKKKSNSNEFLSDDPLSLLLPLVSGEGGSDEDLNDDKAVSNLCHKLFQRLDRDGDGTISWWEWVTVIEAKLMSRAGDALINPTDGLILQIETAKNALSAHQSLRTLDPIDEVPFITVTANSNSSIATEDADLAALENIPPAKAVPRLQNMVKSLRNNNNLLSQRLEKALLASQGISAEYEIVDGKLSPRRAQVDIDFFKQEIAAVTRKQKDIEGQYKNVHSAFMIEKQVYHIISLLSSSLPPISSSSSSSSPLSFISVQLNWRLKLLD